MRTTQFKTRDGRSWWATFDAHAERHAGQQLRVSLSDLARFSPARLVGYFQKHLDVLAGLAWLGVRDCPHAQGLDPEQFARLFDADTVVGLAEALVYAIAERFPTSTLAKVLKGAK